jgi:hypothetical protein
VEDTKSQNGFGDPSLYYHFFDDILDPSSFPLVASSMTSGKLQDDIVSGFGGQCPSIKYLCEYVVHGIPGKNPPMKLSTDIKRTR